MSMTVHSISSFADNASILRQQEIGRRTYIQTPFGRRLIHYADFAATGRHLEFVENWIRRTRPFYANTHAEISSTGRLMTELREAARLVIRRAVHAADQDEVLFVGSGATAAVNKLVGLLGLRIPEPLERHYELSRQIPPGERPVVFVGPYEHHSNEIPWLESIVKVVEIGLEAGGGIDLTELVARLEEYSERPLKIGSFSAASNVTGVLSEVRNIARVLHRAGALAVFDYAAAGPYVPIDMHPPVRDERIDALFLSPHKFIGGPEASGILVANRGLFRTRVPERPGGGTVEYVAGPHHEDVDYTRRFDLREEGGTPAILGDLRAGLAFLVKERIGAEAIREHEIALARRAAQRLSQHPRIRVLGPTNLPRLAIIPVAIEGLHHGLVSVLLDHLFGIQNRPGCSCAGPYGHRLLGISREASGRIRRLVRRGIQGVKPGWTRVSLPFYASEEDLEFVLSAIEFVASHGLDFLPLYRLNWRDGAWRHIDRPANSWPLVLDAETLWAETQGHGGDEREQSLTDAELRMERARYFMEAEELRSCLRERWEKSPPAWNPPTGDPEVDGLVRFRYVQADDLK